jgi:two-component SAPR family response regulator
MEISAIKQQINIHTLGKFFIRRGDSVLSENSSRSRRMWEVFKYLLSNRDKSFFPEEILDNIWPEKDYSDPNTVMRAQMFRLRQALNNDNTDANLASNIVFSRGCYRWENKIECWVDVDDFAELADRASKESKTNPEQAIEYYNSALNLYKGEYLPESAFSEWVIPVRTYYHDIFLKSVFELTDLYRARHNNNEIIRVCEQAAAIDYFEEKIHIRLIEALLAEGLTTRARAHYNEVTSAYYREMGVKPSDAMKSIYRLIGLESGSFELDLGAIQEGLKGKEVVNGAYFCDAELFRYFYKLERVRGERSGKSILLCLMTLTNPDYSMPAAEKLKKVMNNFQQVILDSLRKGDIVTRWNDAQFLMLLPGLNREQAMSVMDRIENSYRKEYNFEDLYLHKKVETVLPLEGDSHFF